MPTWVRGIRLLSGVLGAVSAALILAAVLLTCQMIWVRYINNASTAWQTEAVRYLMIGATLLGLPYVQLLRGHVNVDLIPRLLSPRIRKLLAVFTLLMAMLVIAVMLFYAAELWYVALDKGWKSDTVWGPPLWIPYLVMPVGFAAYLLQLMADLSGIINDEDSEEQRRAEHEDLVDSVPPPRSAGTQEI